MTTRTRGRTARPSATRRMTHESLLDQALTIAVSQFAIGHPDVRPDDLDDLRQEAALAVLPRLAAFDPSRASWRTYVTNLAVHAVANAHRVWRRRRHARWEECYAHPSDCPAWHGVSDLLGGRMVGQPLSAHTDGTEQHYLGMAVRAALAAVTPHQRDICERIMHGQRIAAVARGLGLSRMQIYRELATVGRALLAAGVEVRRA